MGHQHATVRIEPSWTVFLFRHTFFGIRPTEPARLSPERSVKLYFREL